MERPIDLTANYLFLLFVLADYTSTRYGNKCHYDKTCSLSINTFLLSVDQPIAGQGH